MSERRLIINADDYGLCREVNDAIEELNEASMLGGVSVLANGGCSSQAIRYLSRAQQLSAGAHLNTVEGTPVSASSEVEIIIDRNGAFLGLPGLLRRWMRHPSATARAVETEWRAQIERLIASGIKLHHADSHQHLHAFPPAFGCAVTLCREYGITALRIPNERVQDYRRFVGTLALCSSSALSHLVTSTRGLQCNDHFLGFRRAGHYTAATLLAEIASLPAGLTELAVHPSTRDGLPYAEYESGRERAALLDTSFRNGLRELEVNLVSWADTGLREDF